MAKLASIPANRKLFGFNIVPKQADIVNGLAWPNMILSWDWAGWIKPQIDLMAGNNVGCNVVRIIGANAGVVSGMYTQAFYDGRVKQLADYCAGLGLYLYPCGGDNSNLGGAVAVSLPAIVESLSTTFRLYQEYPSIGIDLCQEANQPGGPGNTNLLSMIAALKADGITLPITCSTAEINVTSAVNAPWITTMGQYFDYIDVHNYTYPLTMQWFDYLLTTFSAHDIIMGEFGRAISIPDDQRSADLDQAYMLANSGNPRIRGALVWAATDQSNSSSDQWGYYDANFMQRQRMLNLMRKYTGGSLAVLNRKVF